MLTKFIGTATGDYAALIARLALGVVMAGHGAQKALGLFGGPGWSNAVAFLTNISHSSLLANLVIIGEFIGGIALILGFLSRFCAASILVIMLGAVFLVHLPNGLLGQGGFELHVLAIALALIVIIRGGGAWSFDSIFSK